MGPRTAESFRYVGGDDGATSVATAPKTRQSTNTEGTSIGHNIRSSAAFVGSNDETNFIQESCTESYQHCDVHMFDSQILNVHNFLPLVQPECRSLIFINEKKEECVRNSSFHSYFDDFFYAPSEKIGPFINILRSLFYDHTNPEFTSRQQSSWAVLLGIFFGVTTALWQRFIEISIYFIWQDIPKKLLQKGFFTDLNGSFPLPHYCWICTSIFGGILSWVSASLPVIIPGQNEWIDGVHQQGIIDPSAFWYILLISTGVLVSGLSLGPELPLVLLSGMVGSFLAVQMNQSVSSARIMVLTAGGAAVGGFFGFPMAGALFVLELPHRMGLQYFEALLPANISSIIAVLFNRIVTANGLQGYYKYPFAMAPLKSHIFYIAIVYGLVGALVGTIYCKSVMALKTWVHDWFHERKPAYNANKSLREEALLIVGSYNSESPNNEQFSVKTNLAQVQQKNYGCFITHKQTRAAVVGIVAGFSVGIICMLLPHNFFWGEAQLQTLIDRGRTQLPFFGRNNEPADALLAWSYCLGDPADPKAVLNGPGLLCNFAMFASKFLCIGLSVGTGIVGGQFWGPIYVGAVASNFFIDFVNVIYKYIGIGSSLFQHPCIALLCIMGSAHVAVFRAHTAIVLLLMLTISAFEEGSKFFTTENFAAVFPLLVVSCFVSLIATQGVVFYNQQRCRSDTITSPGHICKAGKTGKPIVVTAPIAENNKYEFIDEESFRNDVCMLNKQGLEKKLDIGKVEEPPLTIMGGGNQGAIS